jgi:hypothetical protein
VGRVKAAGRCFGSAPSECGRAADDGARRSGADWGRRRLGRDRGRKEPGWAGAGPKGCGDLGQRWNFQRKSGGLPWPLGRIDRLNRRACRNCFQIYFKDFDSNQRVLNIFKPNLN